MSVTMVDKDDARSEFSLNNVLYDKDALTGTCDVPTRSYSLQSTVQPNFSQGQCSNRENLHDFVTGQVGLGKHANGDIERVEKEFYKERGNLGKIGSVFTNKLVKKQD